MSRDGEDRDRPADRWRETVRSLLFLGVTICVLGFGTFQAWKRFANVVDAPRGAPLVDAAIQAMPDPPPWISANVAQEVFVQGSLSDHHLSEPGLVKIVHRAFSNHPWVRKVRRASVTSGQGVQVELEYRSPLAVVVNDKVPLLQGAGGVGLVPVDVDAVSLPDLTEQQANELPRIHALGVAPPNGFGHAWRDPRVAHSARIIALLKPLWDDASLYSVHIPPREADRRGVGSYELRTRTSDRIVWGSAPGEERRGEPSAGDKVDELRRLLQENLLVGGQAYNQQGGSVLADLSAPPAGAIESAAIRARTLSR